MEAYENMIQTLKDWNTQLAGHFKCEEISHKPVFVTVRRAMMFDFHPLEHFISAGDAVQQGIVNMVGLQQVYQPKIFPRIMSKTACTSASIRSVSQKSPET